MAGGNSRAMLKLLLYNVGDPTNGAYSSNTMPDNVATIGAALDYILATLYPNSQPSVATEADLPTGVDTPNLGDVAPSVNDYRIVLDYMTTGQAAGYRFFQLEGQPSPQWNLIQNFDSMDSILEQWALNTQALYTNQNGADGGQTIHGGTGANENLVLSANAGDGTNDPALQTGFIELFSNMRPQGDNVFSLGEGANALKDIYIKGILSNDTVSTTVAEMVAAYAHSQVTSGNPHSVSYAELISKLGTVTIDGDVSSVNQDFSLEGNKTFTLSIVDDSHNHTVSTITDFNTGVYDKVKAIIQDITGLTWTFADGPETGTPTLSVTTSLISDLASPAVNKVLVSNAAGDEWVAADGTVELTGDVTGSGTYSSTTDKVEIAATVANASLENISGIELENKTFTSAAGNPTVITATGHNLSNGESIRIKGSTALDGVYAVTVIDPNSFSIATLSGAVDAGYFIPDRANLLYNPTNDEFEVAQEFASISHHQLSNLGNDDHSQYVAINGRSGGQTVQGGISASEDLELESTANATKGKIKFKDVLRPTTAASYSGGWQGTDIGEAAGEVRNIHMKGELIGFRPENVSSDPTPSGTSIGKVVYNTVDGKAKVDNGSAIKVLKYELAEDATFEDNYNATTNTPSISNAGGSKGQIYRVSVAGTQDLGAGSDDYYVNDLLIHDGSVFQKIPTGETKEIADLNKLIKTNDAAIAGGGTITANTSSVKQKATIASASDITLSNTPFGAGTFEDGLEVTVINVGSFVIEIPNSDVAKGTKMNGKMILPPGGVGKLVYDLTSDRYYDASVNF